MTLFWIGTSVGMFVGVCAAVVLIALAMSAKQADEEAAKRIKDYWKT